MAAADCQELVEDETRKAVANALVALAAARFWPHVRIEEMAKVVGLEVTDVQDAVRRWRGALVRPARPRLAREPADEAPRREPARSRRSRPRPTTPRPSPDHYWCSWPAGAHWEVKARMGRNAARRDGISDWCLGHWRQYHNDRAAQRRNGRQAPG